MVFEAEPLIQAECNHLKNLVEGAALRDHPGVPALVAFFDAVVNKRFPYLPFVGNSWMRGRNFGMHKDICRPSVLDLSPRRRPKHSTQSCFGSAQPLP